MNPGGTFTHTFTAGGDFPYICSVHPFMTGSVNVSAQNSPPTVTITNPVSGAVFAAPWTGTVQASPADTDGTIRSVEFFTNSVSAGIVSNAPYNLALSNLPAGSYVLKAVATDNASATGTSPDVTVTVGNPVAVQISNPMMVPQGFRLTYTANTGLVYVVERASVFGNNFTGISTNMATSSSVNFTDTTAISDQKFYRVGRRPNP